MSDRIEKINPIPERPPSPPAAGSAFALPNETKIRCCNAWYALQTHSVGCNDCTRYIRSGDGDLCLKGKEIIAMELAYADTSIEFPQNDQGQARRE